MNINRKICIVFLFLILTSPAESWEGNKFTEEQPFPGKVVAVQSHWSGYNILIENTEVESDYLIVYIWVNEPVRYTRVEAKQMRVFLESAVKLDPKVEIQLFSWCMGPHLLGKQFGEDDLVEKAMRTKNPNNKGSFEGPSPR